MNAVGVKAAVFFFFFFKAPVDKNSGMGESFQSFRK